MRLYNAKPLPFVLIQIHLLIPVPLKLFLY